MGETIKKSETKELKWIKERETALSILTLLAKLEKASRYDLASKLDVSYATVVAYIRKFKEADIVKEIGVVEAERGGTKILYEPTEKALDLLSEVESSKVTTLEMPQPTTVSSLGFYSVPSERGQKIKRRDKIQDVLDDMRVDVAVVVNYKGNPIPIMPISTLGGIDQASAIFNENISKKILAMAIQIAEKMVEREKS